MKTWLITSKVETNIKNSVTEKSSNSLVFYRAEQYFLPCVLPWLPALGQSIKVPISLAKNSGE